MSTYRVFLGAPSVHDIDNDAINYQWQTISSRSQQALLSPAPLEILPTQALDDASRRISLVYQNVIFNDSFDEHDGSLEEEGDSADVLAADQTTAITWLPTQHEVPSATRSRQTMDQSSRMDRTNSLLESQLQTQETQESQSVDYNDASSIARFPAFHFNLHSLISLTELVKRKFAGSMRISFMLLAVLEVEGPDTIRIKNGKDAGKEVAILKVILGDEGGTICKLTAWREVAERWGGSLPSTTSVKRGDIALIENVTAVFDSKSSPAVTASPHLKSNLTICYRTMPYTKDDSRLRPDLRLGRSDAAVRKVANVVAWFENLAGLDKP